MSTISNNAFILLGDEPISASTIKRLALFYDRIFFQGIDDEAIINSGELRESFGSQILEWEARGHYPRVLDFKERYERAFRGIEHALSRKIVTPVISKDIKTINPGSFWLCHGSAITRKELVTAAAYDIDDSAPQIHVPDTIISGMEVSRNGESSKYCVPHKAPFELTDCHDSWNAICHLRVGRAIKSIRLAQALGASPVAVDFVNCEISKALVKSGTTLSLSNQDINDFAIQVGIVDDQKVEGILSDASWDDVFKIRKEILPHVGRARKFILEKTSKSGFSSVKDIESSYKIINEIKSEFQRLKDEEMKAWDSLRIGSVTKAGAGVGAVGVGSVALPMFDSLHSIVMAVVSVGLIGAASVGDQLIKHSSARKSLRTHPLFFLEKIKI